MIGMLITGFIFGCIVSLFTYLFIYFSRKSEKKQMDMFSKYMIIDDLWLKTGSDRNIQFCYMNNDVKVCVKRNSIPYTDHYVSVYYAYINGIECAVAVKLRDGVDSYYGFYVSEEFDNKEVWDILVTAHKAAKEQRELEKYMKETNKKSILKETNNESI